MKGRKPWMKFYPQDWLGDPGLRTCSSAARGLWIDLISLAHEATPYGHVLINGNVPTPNALARMTGTHEAECETLIAELETNGVFSRTRQGIIYSRKMVRNERRAKEGEKAAKKRWNNEKAGGEETIEEQQETSPPNGGPNGVPKGNPLLRGQRPESKKERTYKFEGRVIRLSEADFDKWAESFDAIPDLKAELQSLDDWYAGNPPANGKWFPAVSGALRKRHDRYLAEEKANPSAGNPHERGTVMYQMWAERSGREAADGGGGTCG